MLFPAVVTFVILLSASQPVLAEEPCPFLSNAELEEITGRKLLFKLTSMPLPDGAGTLCDSNVARVIVLSGDNSEGRWEDMMRGFGREPEERIPVPELGEKAYVVHLDPRKDNEYPTALIVVTSGSHTAAISVRAKEGEPAKSAQAQAIELAKIAISRLQ